MCVCVGARARVCVYIYTHAGTQARSVILVSISPAVFLRQSSVYCGGTTESSQIYRDSLEFHSRERPRINLSSALPYNPNNGSVIKFQRERERREEDRGLRPTEEDAPRESVSVFSRAFPPRITREML